jgi:hypothetical protein
MRRIVVETARRKKRARHGGSRQRVEVELADLPTRLPLDDLLALDEALSRLEQTDPVKARLVNLRPITKYCDEHRLIPKDRLALFVQVSQAVQHAHQKGIIHRDIKPSNVLVAPYDGKPVVKVIDFGVAKAAGQPLTEKTLVAGFGALVGTPEYMSPEQAELNNQDIDTRSDIYSLGDKERARLRRQALDWLKANLAAWRKLLETDESKAAAHVQQQMQHWLQDVDFAGVRGPDALAKLPEAERQEWRKLGAEVDELRQCAGDPPKKAAN